MTGYLDMANDIASRMDAGEWPRGSKLPTTDVFAQRYGVSESTAYHALRYLRDQGLIVGRRGGGRYVPGCETDSSTTG